MFPSKALLLRVLISLTAVHAVSIDRRSGKGTLSFITRLNDLGDLSIVEQDFAYIQSLLQDGPLGRRDGTSVGITNRAIDYVAQVGVGTPPTKYSLLIDTGSGYTWLGANKPYQETESSRDTGCTIKVKYGAGSSSGEQWNDTVTLSPELVVNQQSIGVAQPEQASKLRPGDNGILGIGPVQGTKDTVTCDRKKVPRVPTVFDNLYSQDVISQKVLGIYFIPASDSGKGELTFGGYDDSAVVGPIDYVPLNTGKWWLIDQTIHYDGKEIIGSRSGIVDTGAIFVYIASYAFEEYKKLTGGVPHSTGKYELLKITSEQYANLKPLEFNIGGSKPLVLTPNAQIWPRSLNQKIGGSPNDIYLSVVELPSSQDYDFIMGYTFLERYYTVYNATSQKIGFAPTKYTNSEIN